MNKPPDLEQLSYRVALLSGFLKRRQVVDHKVPPFATNHSLISALLANLTPEQKQLYCGHLYNAVIGLAEFHSNDDQFALYEAEPWQKCVAYLRTVS